LELEKKANPDYFLTWSWIYNWLQTYNPQITVVYAELRNTPVALGIFTESIELRHKIIKSNQLKLHQTGNSEQDQIWIEYNNFIADPEHRIKAVNQCLEYLVKNKPDCDELIISMMEENYKTEYKIKEHQSFIVNRTPSYLVDLADLRRAKQSNYLQTLSKNTRYQINRAMREYGKTYGSIQISKAQSVSDALKLFKTAGEAHKIRWSDSGFKNHYFTSFHENLIRDNFDKGEIDILQVTSGDKIIGITYNFVYKKRVYFYLSGLHYEKNGKLKPGLVLHSLAIQNYLEQGYEVYNLMGGYSRYKESLATRSMDLVTVCFQKNKFAFSLENFARHIKSFSLS
jgi:hypothetical protein